MDLHTAHLNQTMILLFLIRRVFKLMPDKWRHEPIRIFVCGHQFENSIKQSDAYNVPEMIQLALDTVTEYSNAYSLGSILTFSFIHYS